MIRSLLPIRVARFSEVRLVHDDEGSTSLVLGDHEEAIEQARLQRRSPVAERDQKLVEVGDQHVFLSGPRPGCRREKRFRAAAPPRRQSCRSSGSRHHHVVTNDAEVRRPRRVLEPSTHASLHDLPVDANVDEAGGRADNQTLDRVGHGQPWQFESASLVIRARRSPGERSMHRHLVRASWSRRVSIRICRRRSNCPPKMRWGR